MYAVHKVQTESPARLTGAVVRAAASWASHWLCLTNVSKWRGPWGIAVAGSEWDTGRPGVVGGWWGWGGLIAFIDGGQAKGRMYRWQMIGRESRVKTEFICKAVHTSYHSSVLPPDFFIPAHVVEEVGSNIIHIGGAGSICWAQWVRIHLRLN